MRKTLMTGPGNFLYHMSWHHTSPFILHLLIKDVMLDTIPWVFSVESALYDAPDVRVKLLLCLDPLELLLELFGYRAFDGQYLHNMRVSVLNSFSLNLIYNV
jgi:hypothetical protein